MYPITCACPVRRCSTGPTAYVRETNEPGCRRYCRVDYHDYASQLAGYLGTRKRLHQRRRQHRPVARLDAATDIALS
jgi:hypothetical protein